MKFKHVEVHELECYGIGVFKRTRSLDERGELEISAEFDVEGANRITLKTSQTRKGYSRGLHIQLPPSPQQKFTFVRSGAILQFFLSLRRDTKDYGTVLILPMNAESMVSIHIPEYFAHGFYAVTDAVFQYACIGEYSEDYELAVGISPLLDKLGLVSNLSKKDLEGMSALDALALHAWA